MGKIKTTIGSEKGTGISVTERNIAISTRHKCVYSCGHWDESICVYRLDGQMVSCQKGRAVCVHLSADERFLSTGSSDTIVSLYVIDDHGDLPEEPSRILTGHFSSVSCVCVSNVVEAVAS